MMNRLLNVMLVLSLVANLGLAVWAERSEPKPPEVSQDFLRNGLLEPEESSRLVRSGRSKPKAERNRARLAVPWALAKDAVQKPSHDQFEISQALISGLELTKEEKQAFDRAITTFRAALRENELSGLQESDDHIIRVILDQGIQEAALGSFVKELEEALPLSKAKILAEASRSNRYLNWTSFDLEVLDQKEGLFLKISHRLKRSRRAPVAMESEPGGSVASSLSAHDFSRLRERWGHMIDFEPLEAVMDQSP